MSLIGDRSASFVVRIWRERSENADAEVEWRGSVECVRSSTKVYFRELRVIEDFLVRQLRQIGIDARRKARIPDKPAASAVASPTTRMNGYVKRSSGPSTVFLNGEGVVETSQPDSPRVPHGKDDKVSVPVGDAGIRVPLKPGEVLDSGTGEVHDVLGGGEIRVRPRSIE